MLTIYGMRTSGNCYKVQLILNHLDIAHCWVDVDSTRGETRTPTFLQKNPNGKVPLLELADGRHLAESNAILCYLAEGSELLPGDRWRRAQVLQWLFFEQYSHEPCVAVARYIRRWLPVDHPRQMEVPGLVARGNVALAVMERQLQDQPFLVEGGFTIADIALYAYTHAAAEGGFDLSAFPAIGAWLARVRERSGHVAMQA